MSDRADRAPGPPSPWWTRPGLATAVALLLAAALGGGAWWQAWHASPNAVDAEDLRAAAVAAEQIPLVAPDVVSAGGDARLAWRAVPGATRSHVEVLGADGAVVHAASTADTVLALPASVRPPAGAASEWSVRTRLPDGVTRRSAAGRLLGAR